MSNTTPFIIGQPWILPFNPSLGVYAWESPQGLEIKPLVNFNLSKALGDAINGLKEWIVKNLVPFIIGILAIIVGIVLFTKIVDIF